MIVVVVVVLVLSPPSPRSGRRNVSFIRVRGLPERRMEVLVCGTGRGLDNDARFVVLVLVVLVVAVSSP